jgi:peptidoglycan/LPS O-acetylase OafA/YrhL
MSDQPQSSNGGTAAYDGHTDRHIAALDGLRFVAAFMVAGGHYTAIAGGAPLSETVSLLTGLGMTLFFVLSGFVIHYNYHASMSRPGGVRGFVVARFARLYPLYILVFLFDFAFTAFTAHNACGQIGMPDQEWAGLVFYLTLTQSWFYTTICNAALAYQYGPVSAVTWSISVEVFFYLLYIVAALLIARLQWSTRTVIRIAVAAYGITLVYFWFCGHYEDDINRAGIAMFGPAASTASGYEYSLLRWLFYFNPAARLAEFLAGMAAAQIYLAPPPRLPAMAPASASEFTLLAILGTLLVHLWLYGAIAPTDSLIGRIASPLYGPLVGLTVYFIARYDTQWSRLLSVALLVQLGEASYSMYMLHEIIPSVFKRLGLVTTDVAAGWVAWFGALLLLALISLASYAMVERPARQWLRDLLAPRRAAPVTTPDS